MDQVSIEPASSSASAILRFWHQAEFFIPFDLQTLVLDRSDADWAVRSFAPAALAQSDARLWQPAIPAGHRRTGFDLFIGVFDKARIADALRAVLQDPPSERELLEWEEGAQAEGWTCMAKLQAGPAGEPLFSEVGVSTVPWALGRIGQAGLAGLDFDAFQTGVAELQEDLRQFRAERMVAQEQASAASLPLDGAELLALLDIFCAWSGYTPTASGEQRGMCLVIRARTAPERPTPAAAEAPEAAPEELSIEILNSFYARDIARALQAQARGQSLGALADYLRPAAAGQLCDLYSEQGRQHLLDLLSPQHGARGRWFDDIGRHPSLMQQAALQSALQRLATQGLFSVNGPPGTGKTTLLRDVFAELVTRRARVLAGLPRAGAAFAGSEQVEFVQADACRISVLRPELTGFEMVLASSNNAAVENLSRDLPRQSALGAEWRAAGLDYLRPIAANIAERDTNGDYRTPDAGEESWGLIACVLGNKRNRNRFVQGLGFDGRGERTPRGFDPQRHQSLWTWREQRRGPSFRTAQQAFRAADEALEQRLRALTRHAQLWQLLAGQSEAEFLAAEEAECAAAQRALSAAQGGLDELEQTLAFTQSQLEDLREEASLLAQDRPAWWRRWFRRAAERRYQREAEANRQQQRQCLIQRRQAEAQRFALARQCEQWRQALERGMVALERRRQEWTRLQAESAALAASFPEARAPMEAAALESPVWQIDGVWRDTELNRLRSALFAAALALHEAWLAEVMQRGAGFGANLVALSRMLSGQVLQRRTQALALWQSLFMMVPVVSTTFASVANQFRDLGADSLGWLFIDEAGQAVPQAAVGALWRARRAMVLGDPLQIEPVQTIPSRLLAALADQAGLPSQPEVIPDRASVQTVADSANPIGAWIELSGGERWVGCPLRVHRRCQDPMFTIANKIAYQGKMIQGLPPKPAASAWYHQGGTVRYKQVVAEQIALAVELVKQMRLEQGGLPEIFIISPFRRVKEALISTLSHRDTWPDENAPSAAALREWCRKRIGTVHTFQGKEEDVVLLVLGCDASTRGAAEWAARKPNLFNVALTRARRQIIVIGDAELWGAMPHFAEAHADLLPRR